MSTRVPAPLEQSEIEFLGSLDTAEQRRDYLDRNPAVIRPESVEALADAVRRYVRLDIGKAQLAADAALAIAERLDDRGTMARALRAKGNSHWFAGDCRTAVELFKRAVILFQQAGDEEELGRTLSTSIQPLILLGDYGAALENAGRAREIFTALNDGLRLARLDINVANIYHRQERFADALAEYERAYQRLVPYRDAEGIGVSLHNMAVCLISLDEFDHALEVYGQARRFLEENGMPRLVLQADYNIAYLYHLRGDYETAIRLLRAARDKCAEDDSYHAALCDLDLSEIYLELNLWTEATEMATRAASLFERLGTRYELARSVANMAIAADRRQSKHAGGLFERAREIFRAERHAAGEALVSLYQAISFCESGDTVNAVSLCRDAAEVFRASALARKAALCDLLLSRLALMDGSIEAADRHCRAAEEQLASLEAPVLSYQARVERGRIHEASGNPAAAAQSFNAAAHELESVRCALDDEELRIAFVSNRLEVYERLAALALEEDHSGPAAERAFGYIERAKSRSLAESIFGQTMPLAARAETLPDPSGKLRRMREELNWFYHRIRREEINEDGVDATRIERLRAQARARENALLELLRENRASSRPEHAGDGMAAVELPEIRAALETGSTLVEYFEIAGRMMAACVTRTDLNIVPLAEAAAVSRRLRGLQLQLSKSLVAASRGTNHACDVSAVNRHLTALYRDLIAPLEKHLEGTHLILVPHGCLHYLPLHALYDGKNYLIDRFTISYAPSAGIFALCRSRASPHDSRSLIIGIEDPRTPWIARELREVASVIPGARTLVGREACVDALRKWGDGSSLVHIATHGSFRTDNPLFSAVQLGDSYLSVYDLYNIRLQVELFTLSGCGTGLNVVAAGDELVGLTRALLYSGVRGVLLTLWDVQDESTAEFMKVFYTHLARTRDKASALRTAMLQTRERYPHPCYWAPFFLVGKVP